MAIPPFKRAVELDPNFARAYAALGVVYYNLSETGLARENWEKAFHLRNRASERERLEIEGYYYGFVTGRGRKQLRPTPTGADLSGRFCAARDTEEIYAELGRYEKRA